MIAVQVQNETFQTEQTLQFVALPRIGEGLHLLDDGGQWASFDVVDVWYQKAGWGDVWIPYLHVRKSGQAPFEGITAAEQPTEIISTLREGGLDPAT